MRVLSQVLSEFRGLWQAGAGVSLLLGVSLSLQNPVTSLRPALGGPWAVAAYVGVTATFAATTVVFLLGAYTAIEDAYAAVYHRLLVYPISLQTALLVRTAPVALWATVAAATVATGLWLATPGLAVWQAVVPVAVVAAATLPLAVLVTLLYLRVRRPRVGSAVLFAALVAVVSIPRRVGVGTGRSAPAVAAVVSLALASLVCAASLAVTRLDREQLVL